MSHPINLIGYSVGLGAGDRGCAYGPIALQEFKYMDTLLSKYNNVHWQTTIKPKDRNVPASDIPTIVDVSTRLAEATQQALTNKESFITVGGDHSSGIGTWSGVHNVLRDKGSFGLIWFDAHLDAHTHDSSPSGNIHGMPVACLLGHGDPALTSILNDEPKVLPENLVMIGIRSYEPGEKALLEAMGVRIYYMEEVLERGMAVVFAEALNIVQTNTVGFGISIDIDGVDCAEAPGVGTPESNGVKAQDLLDCLPSLRQQPNFIGAEVVEFNPNLDDKTNMTATLAVDIIEQLIKVENNDE